MIKVFILFCSLFAFIGCSRVISDVQIQEVYIPIKCNIKIPNKPKEDGTFESHKQLAEYYLIVEQIAKDCTN